MLILTTSQGLSVHSLAIPVGLQLSCHSVQVTYPHPGMARLSSVLPVPPPLSVTRPCRHLRDKSLTAGLVFVLKTKRDEKNKTSTFSSLLGTFCFFNDSFIISPKRPYLFTSKYKLSLHEGLGEERTLFSLCSISFQCDTQFTVEGKQP